jgi:hypothetical protein
VTTSAPNPPATLRPATLRPAPFSHALIIPRQWKEQATSKGRSRRGCPGVLDCGEGHGCRLPRLLPGQHADGVAEIYLGPASGRGILQTQPFSQQAPSSSLPPFVAFFVSDSLGMRGLVGSASPETVAAMTSGSTRAIFSSPAGEMWERERRNSGLPIELARTLFHSATLPLCS